MVPAPHPRHGLAETLADIEFVQADPIRAPARAQDLILRQRVRGYRVGDLDRHYPALDLDEDRLYVYGFVARRLRPYLYPRRHERRRRRQVRGHRPHRRRAGLRARARGDPSARRAGPFRARARHQRLGRLVLGDHARARTAPPLRPACGSPTGSRASAATRWRRPSATRSTPTSGHARWACWSPARWRRRPRPALSSAVSALVRWLRAPDDRPGGPTGDPRPAGARRAGGRRGRRHPLSCGRPT